MQYVMLVRVDPDLAATTEIDDVDPWVEEGAARGLRSPAARSRTRRPRRPSACGTARCCSSDGPFAETKEIVAGYDLLEAPDLETAVDYAGRHPVAAFGALEVREVWADFVDDREARRRRRGPDGIDYLFLHVPDPALLADRHARDRDPTPWVRERRRRRARRSAAAGSATRPTRAPSVRSRDGETADQPRARSRRSPSRSRASTSIRAADLDEAIALAAAHPTARIGAIEVRPFAAG